MYLLQPMLKNLKQFFFLAKKKRKKQHPDPLQCKNKWLLVTVRRNQDMKRHINSTLIYLDLVSQENYHGECNENPLYCSFFMVR